jgi:putative FmdB family regulatory protein
VPTYEYRRPDGTTFEVVQSFSEDPLTEDPETGAPVERVLHAPAVHFKGKGFYNTDYGTRKRQRETAAAGEGSASDSSSGGDSTAADGKGSSESGSGGEAPAKTETKKGESAKPAAKAKPVAATK